MSLEVCRGCVLKMKLVAYLPLLSCKAKSTMSRIGRLDFTNTKEAFKTKSTSDLLRQFVVYKAFTFDLLVNNSDKVGDIKLYMI